MEDMKNDIRLIRESQIRTEEDLKYHIKRTDKIEDMVIPLNNWRIAVKMLGKLLGAILLVTAVIFSVKRVAASDSIYSTLNDIKSEVSCTVKVHSGKRSKLQNERAGGAKHSFHLYGRALDISAECLSMKQLAKIAYKYNTVIVYKSHVHIDNRKGKQCLVRVAPYFRRCTRGEFD